LVSYVFSFLCTLDVGLEGAELVGPERLHLVKPRLQGNERLRAQPVHAKASVLVDPLLLDFDEAAGPEHSQVPAHRRTAHRGSGGEFASPAGTLSEHFYHLAPGWVGQRSERSVKIIDHWFSYPGY
jgi:hypothetical protein